jgi:phosphohistidine phosphatase SixA
MGGGPAGAQQAGVKDDEVLWRLIAPHWYPADPSTGLRAIDEAAFSHNSEVSALRSALVSEADVKQHFPNHGIAELPVAEVKKAGCIVQIKDEQPWPTGAHVVIRKAPNGSRLKPRQIFALTQLANANLRLPPNVP